MVTVKVFPNFLLILLFLSLFLSHFLLLGMRGDKERRGKRERNRWGTERKILLVYSPNAHKVWNWARAEAEGWEFHPGLPGTWVAGTQPLGSITCCLPGSTLTGSWTLELEPKFESRYSNMEHECSKLVSELLGLVTTMEFCL